MVRRIRPGVAEQLDVGKGRLDPLAPSDPSLGAEARILQCNPPPQTRERVLETDLGALGGNDCGGALLGEMVAVRAQPECGDQADQQQDHTDRGQCERQLHQLLAQGDLHNGFSQPGREPASGSISSSWRSSSSARWYTCDGKRRPG